MFPEAVLHVGHVMYVPLGGGKQVGARPRRRQKRSKTMSTEPKKPITQLILIWRGRDSEVIGIHADRGCYRNIREMFLRWLQVDADRLDKVMFVRRGWTGENDIEIETIWPSDFEQPRTDCDQNPTFQTAAIPGFDLQMRGR